jgi:hypothetical protein
MAKFTQERIDEFKIDLQQWYDDYVAAGETGEWESQLEEVFRVAYGGD